jgi:hypothetical protein
MNRAQYIYSRAELPNDLKRNTFQSNDNGNGDWQSAKTAVLDIIGGKVPESILIISGKNNTGKSVLLACAAAAAASKGDAVRYFAEIDFMKKTKETWGTDNPPPRFPIPCLPYMVTIDDKTTIFDNYRRILLWDELGYCDYIQETSFFDIFNYNIDVMNRLGVKILFATNYSEAKLKDRVGKRFWARLERRGIIWRELIYNFINHR